MSPPTPVIVPVAIIDNMGNSHTVYTTRPWNGAQGSATTTDVPVVQSPVQSPVMLATNPFVMSMLSKGNNPFSTAQTEQNNSLPLSISNMAQHKSLFANGTRPNDFVIPPPTAAPAQESWPTTSTEFSSSFNEAPSSVGNSSTEQPSVPSTGSASGHSNNDNDESPRVGSNVYVSNLPSTMTQSKFRLLFSNFGTIIGARLVKRRKGDAPIGFVQFTTPDMAQAAITKMDGRQVEGASLSVRLANRDKDKGINNKPSSNLYVANLPQKVTELDLRIIFSRYGDIHSLRVLKYPNTGVSKGTALVRFVSIEDATRAKDALHCLPLHGQDLPLEVKYAETKEEKVSRRDNRASSDKPATASTTAASAPAPHSNGGVEDLIGRYRSHWKNDDAPEEQPVTTAKPTEGMLATCMDTPSSPFVKVSDSLSFLGTQPNDEEGSEGGMRALTDYIQWMMRNKEEADTKAPSNPEPVGHAATNPTDTFAYSPSPMGSLNGSSLNASPLNTNSPFLDMNRQGDASPLQQDTFQLRREAPPFVSSHQTPIGELGDMSIVGQQQAPVQSDVLRVTGLPASMDKLALYQLFTPWGAILHLDTSMNKQAGTNSAVVKFRHAEDAAMAHFKLNGEIVQGHQLEAKLGPMQTPPSLFC